MRKVKEERPQLLIGSPMCTSFFIWQRLNNLIRIPVKVAAEKKRAVEHLEFRMELHREQMRHGRCFLHEHPAYASSWHEEVVQKVSAASFALHAINVLLGVSQGPRNL